jgi:acetyl-CoA synthetase
VSDTIVFGGVVVPLEAAEAALTCRDDVAQAVAFGATDNFLGQALHIYVVLEAGTAQSNDLRSELLSAVADELNGVRPRGLRFVDRIPRTTDGSPARAVISAVVNGGDIDVSSLVDPDALDAIRNAR